MLVPEMHPLMYVQQLLSTVAYRQSAAALVPVRVPYCTCYPAKDVLYHYSQISTDVVFSTWDPPSIQYRKRGITVSSKEVRGQNRGIVSTQE